MCMHATAPTAALRILSSLETRPRSTRFAATRSVGLYTCMEQGNQRLQHLSTGDKSFSHPIMPNGCVSTTNGSLTFKARPAVSRTECSSSKSALLKISAGDCDLVGIDERSSRFPISAACVSWLSSSGVAGADGGGDPVSSTPAPEKAVDRASMVLQTASRTSCQRFCFHVRILV